MYLPRTLLTSLDVMMVSAGMIIPAYKPDMESWRERTVRVGGGRTEERDGRRLSVPLRITLHASMCGLFTIIGVHSNHGTPILTTISIAKVVRIVTQTNLLQLVAGSLIACQPLIMMIKPIRNSLNMDD